MLLISHEEQLRPSRNSLFLASHPPQKTLSHPSKQHPCTSATRLVTDPVMPHLVSGAHNAWVVWGPEMGGSFCWLCEHKQEGGKEMPRAVLLSSAGVSPRQLH